MRDTRVEICRITLIVFKSIRPNGVNKLRYALADWTDRNTCGLSGDEQRRKKRFNIPNNIFLCPVFLSET